MSNKTRIIRTALTAAILATFGVAHAAGNSNNSDTYNTTNNTTNAGGAGGTGGAGGNGYGGVGIGIGQGGNATGGTASATGGAVVGSGNSSATGGSVLGSGNSTNTNTNVLGQQQGQAQGQQQTATSSSTGGNAKQSQSSANTNDNRSSASNSNSNSNANSGNNSAQSVTVQGDTYQAARIPVATAYAPNIAPTAICMGSSSAGGQGMTFGFSVGTSWTDSNCVLLEQVRTTAAVLGDKDTAAEMMCGVPIYAEARARTGRPCGTSAAKTSDTTSAPPMKVAQAAPAQYTDPLIRSRLGLPPLK